MKTNELADMLGVSKATIRYYEEQGLVAPSRTKNNYRYYSDEEARLFQKIIILRKLGVSVSEIKDLIENKAKLHDVLEQNENRLRAQQDEAAAAIEICERIRSDAADFDGIDSPNILRMIYEASRNGARFTEIQKLSDRDLNLAITLLSVPGGYESSAD